MNPPGRNQQIEFDVFPKENKSQYGYLSDVVGAEGRATSSVNVVFSHQSVFFIFICLTMLLVASFALGVEKGKLTAKREEAPPPTVVASVPSETAAPVLAAVMPSSEKGTPAAKEETPAAPAQKQEEKTKAEAAGAGAAASGYTIQVASVQSPSAAQALAESLTKKGFNSFTKASGKYVVVLAGNFTKREDAQGSLKELKKTFSDCYIKKI